MSRPTLEVADIFHRYGNRYRQNHKVGLSPEQSKVMGAIEACRTKALGGHLEQCDRCKFKRNAFNSCRNRHCPKCQSLARTKWVEDRRAELLETEYFHVVFTLPQQIAAIALQNKSVVYNLLFQATAETLKKIAADPKHLGAEIGCIAVLHTWGQNLLHHPHLHCIIPGGGLSPGQEDWISCRLGFFLPVRVLSRLFRRLFLEGLQQAFDQRKLHFFSSLSSLEEQQAFEDYLKPLRSTEWVVYAKPPFGGPEQVLAYLGRYTHRVALSNHRLVSANDDQVTFHWKDYRKGNTQKTMTLEVNEFIRRFLLHVLPHGFQRIRHFGFFGNRYRKEKLALCRLLLKQPLLKEDVVTPVDYRDLFEQLTGHSLRKCPHCDGGNMKISASLLRVPRKGIFDTS